MFFLIKDLKRSQAGQGKTGIYTILEALIEPPIIHRRNINRIVLWTKN